MKTIYGAKIETEVMVDYFEDLINQIYKLLTMHKDDEKYDEDMKSWDTLDSYLYSFLCEIAGGNKLILNDKYFLKLLNNLENLRDIKEDYVKYRSQVFKCISVCEKIIKSLNQRS